MQKEIKYKLDYYNTKLAATDGEDKKAAIVEERDRVVQEITDKYEK